MANPWDRQPRESGWLSDPGQSLACPVCLSATDSLKQYRFISWAVFYLIGATYQQEIHRACPACMRKHIGRRMAWNLIPANLLWFMMVLPWGVTLIVATYRKGHSQDVMRNITPYQAAVLEYQKQAAAHEVSWGRVWLIVAVLFIWAPLFGLALAAAAYITNRKTAGWKRTISILILFISVLLHVAMVVLMALG